MSILEELKRSHKMVLISNIDGQLLSIVIFSISRQVALPNP